MEQVFFAGDGDDDIQMGNNYHRSYGYGGQGNDIIRLPEYGASFLTA